MQYLISFLEGVITFISPCLLPMLPVYISYFAGGGERNIRKKLAIQKEKDGHYLSYSRCI